MRLPHYCARARTQIGGLTQDMEWSIIKPFVVGPLADTLVDMIPRVPPRGVRRRPVVLKPVVACCRHTEGRGSESSKPKGKARVSTDDSKSGPRRARPDGSDKEDRAAAGPSGSGAAEPTLGDAAFGGDELRKTNLSALEKSKSPVYFRAFFCWGWDRCCLHEKQLTSTV